MGTPFSKQCEILAQLWVEFRYDEDFAEFIKYNDVSLPLAYFIANDIVTDISEKGQNFIEETWALLMNAMDFPLESEWDSLIEIIEAANEQNSGE